MAWLEGKKTYIVAGVMVAYALVQWWSGSLTGDSAINMILTALGFGALRSGVSKAGG